MKAIYDDLLLSFYSEVLAHLSYVGNGAVGVDERSEILILLQIVGETFCGCKNQNVAFVLDFCFF